MTLFFITINVLALAIIAGQRLILKKLHLLIHQNSKTIMDQKQLAADLVALKNQNEKAKGEITAKFAALEAAIGKQRQTTPEVDAALADLKVSIQGTDDIVPDAPAGEGITDQPGDQQGTTGDQQSGESSTPVL